MDVLLTHCWSPCWLPLWKIMNMEELFCIYKTNVLFVLSPSYPKKDLQAFAWKAQLLMQPVLTRRTSVAGREIRSLCGDLALPLLQVEPLLCPPHSSHTLWRIHIWMLLLTTLKKLEFFNPQRPKRQWMAVTNIMLLILFFQKKNNNNKNLHSTFLNSWKEIKYNNRKIPLHLKNLCWIKKNTFILI